MAERGREILRAAGIQVSDAYGTACDLAVAATLAGGRSCSG